MTITRTKISAIALAFSALFAGHAMAADNGPATRDQVRAELAEAVRTGNIFVGESGQRLNEMFPHNYPAQDAAESKTHEQVRAELDEAIRAGNVVVSDSGKRLNEIFPHRYPEQQNVASKTREQVRAELAEAARNGWFDHNIEA